MTACACEHCGHEFDAEPKGGHRLLCGSSTETDAVDRLMNGERAVLVAADPPYLVDDKGCDHPPSATNRRALNKEKTGRIPTAIGAGVGEHESCLYGRLGGHAPPVDRRPPANEQTMWQIDGKIEDGVSGVRPTQKPVEIVARPIRYHTKPGELIFEPFSGSGTASVAAEKEGRRCYGMELSPAFVDVIVMRGSDKIDDENGIIAEHSRVLEASKRGLEKALITLTPATRGPPDIFSDRGQDDPGRLRARRHGNRPLSAGAATSPMMASPGGLPPSRAS